MLMYSPDTGVMTLIVGIISFLTCTDGLQMVDQIVGLWICQSFETRRTKCLVHLLEVNFFLIAALFSRANSILLGIIERQN